MGRHDGHQADDGEAAVLLAVGTYILVEAVRRLFEPPEVCSGVMLVFAVIGLIGNAIEILVLQALAHQLRGDLPAASIPLERALCMAEPEGYVRVFVDDGPPMAPLLTAAAKQGVAPGYVRTLLWALAGAEDGHVARSATTRRSIKPLSRRELDVLRLLVSDLGGPEILRELIVSLNTVRTHTKNIYAKLGVTNRRAAVRRAIELNL